MSPCRIASLSRLLVALGCGALLGGAQVSRAARPVPASENKSLHEWANFGGLPRGVEPLAGTAVSNAIFFPIDSGTVDLKALLRSGSTAGSINITVYGYAAGDYTVSVLTESSSSTVVLGTLSVTSGTLPIGTGVVLDPPKLTAASSNVIALPPFGFTSGSARFGGKKAPFPNGFSPFDVATLSLSDSNSNVVATTTLTPVPDGYYSALSPLAAGASAPDATGFALIRANTPPVFLPLARIAAAANGSIWGGPVPVVPPIIIDPLPPVFKSPKTGDLVIHAHGLPASTTLTYAADGTDLGTATTDASGNLAVFAGQGKNRKLPSTLDLFSVKTVTVHDASGNVLLSAGF